MKLLQKIYNTFLCLLCVGALSATDIDSSTTASDGYQGSFINGTTLAGFGLGSTIKSTVIFKQGFEVPDTALAGNLGEIAYDADGPICSNINWVGNSNDGTLLLYSDLRLGTTGKFTATAPDIYTIINATPVKLIDGATSIPAGIKVKSIILGGDTKFTNSLKLTTSCIIDGRGHTLTLQAPLALFSTSTSVTLQNMRLEVVKSVGSTSGSNQQIPFIFNSDNQSQSLNLIDVDLCLPTGTVTQLISAGRLNIGHNVRILGPGGTFKVFYKGAGTASSKVIVSKNSKLYIGQDTTFSLWGAPNVPQNNRLILTDATSQFWLDGAKFDISDAGGGTTHGIMLTKGTLFLDNKVTLSSTTGGAIATSMSQGLQLGDGVTAANDLNVRVRGGANVIQIGPMRYNHS